MAINTTLEEENELITKMIATVAEFSPTTDLGKRLKQGWIEDLGSWLGTNRELLDKDPADQETSLQTEIDQLQCFIDVTIAPASAALFSPDPNHSGGWWKEYLEGEQATAQALKDEVST